MRSGSSSLPAASVVLLAWFTMACAAASGASAVSQPLVLVEGGTAAAPPSAGAAANPPPATAGAAVGSDSATPAAASAAKPDSGAAAAVKPPAPSMAIVFDTVSKERMISVEPNVPFDFYVVARSPEGGLTGWEARVILDSRIAVLQREADGLNVAGNDSWRVGLGETCKRGDEIVLVHYKAIVWVKDQSDITIGLGAIDQSSWDPPSVGYLTCLRAGDIRPMKFDPVAAVVNPVKVRVEDAHGKGPAALFTPAREKH